MLRAVLDALDTALDAWLPAAVYYAAYVAARLRKAAHVGWRAGHAPTTDEVTP